jgi:hypothetical protein
MHSSRADLSQAFCSYCGYPPMGRWRSLAHRVCMRCEMGTVLRAPPGLQPRFDEPFVIVDSRLRLQAVSYHAEAMLAVDEPAAIDVPLEVFLSCHTDQDQIDLAGLVGRAVGGSRLATRVEMRTVGDPAIEVGARIAGCGPPPAALVILTPPRKPGRRRSARGRRRTAVADPTLAG